MCRCTFKGGLMKGDLTIHSLTTLFYFKHCSFLKNSRIHLSQLSFIVRNIDMLLIFISIYTYL
eukprot:UN03651